MTDEPRWDQNLSPEQIVAASHSGTHARLLAGPGTGKTLCLTRRVVRLLAGDSMAPQQILVVTFTRGARAELRKRIMEAVGVPERVPNVSTLHSYALKLLMRYPEVSELPNPLRISDDWEDRWIVAEELKGILNLAKVSDAQKLLRQLSADWEQLTADSEDWKTRFPNPGFLGAWREHRTIYGYALRAELVYRVKQMLTGGELVGLHPPRCIVVDEYQDLNACDLAVIRALSKAGSEVYCAGDDDQSIYGFRFANPEGIRRFVDEYSPATALQLEECKRCDRRILEFALFVARQDPRRLEKRLVCRPDAQEGEVNVLRFDDQADEADGVARICRNLVNDRGISPGEILVLLRSDSNGVYSTPIEAALTGAGVPVTVGSDPLAPFNEDESRTFLSLLRLDVNPEDGLAWRTILQTRPNRIGTGTLVSVYEVARKAGVGYIQALAMVSADPACVGRLGPRLASEIEAVRALLREIASTDKRDVSALVRFVADRSFTDAPLKAKVLALADEALALSGAESLDSLIRAINTAIGDKEAERDPNKVSIMTMHQAKGLTADAVIVVGAENESIPGESTGAQFEDERRLLYVSLSRARHWLFVTHCGRRLGRQTFTGSKLGKPYRSLTQFLRDAPVVSTDGRSFTLKLEKH